MTDIIYLFSGYSADDGYVNDIWRSLDSGVTWSCVTTNASWSAREYHTTVKLHPGLLFLAGSGEASTKYNDVWRSISQGYSWTCATSSANWTPRYDTAAISFSDNSIILLGGLSSLGQEADIWKSTDFGITWVSVTSSADWGTRDSICAVTLSDDSLILIGGYGAPEPYYKNDVWKSTDKGETWTCLTSSAEWQGRYDHEAVVLSDDTIILGPGYSTTPITTLKEVWKSTNGGINWTLVSSNPEFGSRRSYSLLASTQDTIYLIAGYDGGINVYNDVWKSTNSGANWSLVTSSAAWTSRTNQTGDIFTILNDTIYIFGGNDGDYLNDVWVSTNGGISWSCVTSSADWSVRESMEVLPISNTNFVLFGGYTPANYLNDIWESTDSGITWSLATSSAEWKPREYFEAIKTTNAFILFGGWGS